MCVDGPLYAHPVDLAEGGDRPVRARQLAAGQAGYGLADVARHITKRILKSGFLSQMAT